MSILKQMKSKASDNKVLAWTAIITILAALIFVFNSCNKTEINGEEYKTQTVKEGKQSCGVLVTPHSRKLHQELMFDYNCWYPEGSIPHEGWNKITGLSGLDVHKKSGRIIFRPYYDSVGFMRVGHYTYGAYENLYPVAKSGYLAIEFNTLIETMYPFEVDVIAHGDYWEYKLLYGEHYEQIYIKADMPVAVFPYPYSLAKRNLYHGGLSVAPQDMTIYYRDLK